MSDPHVDADNGRERCPIHGFVMVEHFREEGNLLIPLGTYSCTACDRGTRNDDQ